MILPDGFIWKKLLEHGLERLVWHISYCILQYGQTNIQIEKQNKVVNKTAIYLKSPYMFVLI